ncbi:MAG: AgmX/PglI C-terminal domain-containing protein, partial [Myxococcota bacterium]
ETSGKTRAGGWVFAALPARAATHRDASPPATRAFVAPGQAVPWGAVLGTLAAARGSGCAEAAATCTLPELVLGSAGPNTIAGVARKFDPDMAVEKAGILGSLGAAGLDPDEDVWGGLTGDETGEAFGVGGLGLPGGKKGTGVSIGSSKGSIKATVTPGKATVKGGLDAKVITRVVQLHTGALRACYVDGLEKSPTLAGDVSIQFAIGPTGKVSVAVVAKTSLKDKNVGNCFAKTAKRWKFPKPAGGGNVVVTFPFSMKPE